jgi:16S rRNA (cytidine1402-2'-O)-methyltransferase
MGILYIVATPIGNMEDITLRALRTLREVNAIFAEDTRVISKLLAKYEIRTSVYRLDAKMEHKRADEIIERMGGGENIAFVSDAGTPGISDPGTYLVGRVRAAGLKVETIPGPSALTAALSIAGVPIDEFTFIGFLPHKKGRKTALEATLAREHATVLYESPHRILKLLAELDTLMPERKVVVARELTKMFEDVRYDTPAALAASLTKDKADRGEFVVIIPYK